MKRSISLREALVRIEHRVGPEARAQLLASLRRGEVRAVAGTLRHGSGVRDEINKILEPSFWQQKQLRDFDFRSSYVRSILEGREVEAFDIHAAPDDIERGWPASKLHANKGGRPGKWDWEGALIEAAAYVHEHGRPEPQSKMIKHLMQWFADQGAGESPDEREVRKRVARLCARLKGK